MERLGWANTPAYAWSTPVFNCLWPSLRGSVGNSLRELFEERMPQERFDCSEIDQSMLGRIGITLR